MKAKLFFLMSLILMNIQAGDQKRRANVLEQSFYYVIPEGYHDLGNIGFRHIYQIDASTSLQYLESLEKYMMKFDTLLSTYQRQDIFRECPNCFYVPFFYFKYLRKLKKEREEAGLLLETQLPYNDPLVLRDFTIKMRRIDPVLAESVSHLTIEEFHENLTGALADLASTMDRP